MSDNRGACRWVGRGQVEKVRMQASAEAMPRNSARGDIPKLPDGLKVCIGPVTYHRYASSSYV